jgi:predicted hydrolase (HD superfamily)
MTHIWLPLVLAAICLISAAVMKHYARNDGGDETNGSD